MQRRAFSSSSSLLTLLLVVAGCGDDTTCPTPEDGGGGMRDGGMPPRDGGSDGGMEEPDGGAPIPLKEAKLNIEHNATDEDTGFQGAIDSEGWSSLDVTGPGGQVLRLEGRGTLEELGLTELFFETVEPPNADVPIADMLARLPEGNYVMEGPAMILGVPMGTTQGTALLTHDIPAGPVLTAPVDDAVVSMGDVVMSWDPVTVTITGDPVTIIAYQLIVEKVADPHPHMIGKMGSLSMYLPPTVTSIPVPAAFFEPATEYEWEVLAIEESGNQTLSSGGFSTEP